MYLRLSGLGDATQDELNRIRVQQAAILAQSRQLTAVRAQQIAQANAPPPPPPSLVSRAVRRVRQVATSPAGLVVLGTGGLLALGLALAKLAPGPAKPAAPPAL